MKINRLALLLVLTLLITLAGCEGDDGPAGPAGPAGIDGNVACLACHNTDTQNSITLQYQRSQHALGEFVDYAGSRSYCAECHSSEGFIEWTMTGDVGGNISRPSPIGCTTCHSVHATFEEADFALRTTAAVPWIGDVGFGESVIDFGDSSNLCANCHQSRRGEPNITDPGTEFRITSTHYGPHHGAQANILAGVLFAEIAGSTNYPTSSLHLTVGATCITCHMGDLTEDGTGGHTWHTSLDACNGCHTVDDTDFDHGDVQTEVAGLLLDLRDLLEAQGIIEYVEEDEAWEPIPNPIPDEGPVPDPYTMAQGQAFFNWIGITEDRSLGAHNPAYVIALLENSIEAITQVVQ